MTFVACVRVIGGGTFGASVRTAISSPSMASFSAGIAGGVGSDGAVDGAGQPRDDERMTKRRGAVRASIASVKHRSCRLETSVRSGIGARRLSGSARCGADQLSSPVSESAVLVEHDKTASRVHVCGRRRAPLVVLDAPSALPAVALRRLPRRFAARGQRARIRRRHNPRHNLARMHARSLARLRSSGAALRLPEDSELAGERERRRARDFSTSTRRPTSERSPSKDTMWSPRVRAVSRATPAAARGASCRA